MYSHLEKMHADKYPFFAFAGTFTLFTPFTICLYVRVYLTLPYLSQAVLVRMYKIHGLMLSLKLPQALLSDIHLLRRKELRMRFYHLFHLICSSNEKILQNQF